MWHLPATLDGVNLKLAGITSKSWITSLFSTEPPKSGPASHLSGAPPNPSQAAIGRTAAFQLRLSWTPSSHADPQPRPTSTGTPTAATGTQAAALRGLRVTLATPRTHPPTPDLPPAHTPAVEVVSAVFVCGPTGVVAVVGGGCLAVGCFGAEGLPPAPAGTTGGGGHSTLPPAASTFWEVVEMGGDPVRELRVVAVVERVVHILVVRQHAWELVGLTINGGSESTADKISRAGSTPLQRIAHGEAKDIGGQLLDLLKTGNSQYLLLFGGWPVLLASAGHSKVVDIRGGATAGCFIDEKHFLVCTHAPTGSQISVWAFTIQDGIKVKEKAAFDTPEKIVKIWNLSKDVYVFSDAQCRIGWVSKKDLLISGPKLGWVPDVLGIAECVWLDTDRELQTTKPATNDANSKAFGVLVRTDAGYLETVGTILDKGGIHSSLIRDGVQPAEEWYSPTIPGVPRAKLWGIIRAPPLAFAWDNQSLE